MRYDTKESVKSALKTLILDIIDDEDLEEIEDNDHFENDLDMDSLQGTSLLIHLERMFKIKLDQQEMTRLSSLSLLTDRLWEQMKLA